MSSPESRTSAPTPINEFKKSKRNAHKHATESTEITETGFDDD